MPESSTLSQLLSLPTFSRSLMEYSYSPRKHALDIGEYGLGAMANSLELGCDCLGSIHYLDTCYTGHDGRPVEIKKAVCIHEEDDGILWKVCNALSSPLPVTDICLRYSTPITELEDEPMSFDLESS